jgi:DNA-binding transcriptional LysR family regulator
LADGLCLEHGSAPPIFALRHNRPKGPGSARFDHDPLEAPLDLLASLSTFIRVAETGSFSAVAREAATSQSAVTRQIAQLEAHYGVRLLHRSTRRLSLTDDGEGLLERARQLVDDATAMQEVWRGRSSGPSGLVRLGVSVSGAQYLAPRLPILLQRHPGLSVELDVSDAVDDMIENRIDVALRAGEIDDTSLIARRVGTIPSIAVAAADYLDRAGSPAHPDDLASHCCIVSGGPAKETIWRFVGPDGPIAVSVRGSLRVNNTEVARRIALAGHGIAMLPGFHVLDSLRDGRLIRVLGDYPSPGMPIHLVYPSRRNLPPRTRVLMDFLAEQVSTAQNAQLA